MLTIHCGETLIISFVLYQLRYSIKRNVPSSVSWLVWQYSSHRKSRVNDWFLSFPVFKINEKWPLVIADKWKTIEAFWCHFELMILNLFDVFQFTWFFFFSSYEVNIFRSLTSGRLFRSAPESRRHWDAALLADVIRGFRLIYFLLHVCSEPSLQLLIPFCGEWCRVLEKLSVPGWVTVSVPLQRTHLGNMCVCIYI